MSRDGCLCMVTSVLPHRDVSTKPGQVHLRVSDYQWSRDYDGELHQACLSSSNALPGPESSSLSQKCQITTVEIIDPGYSRLHRQVGNILHPHTSYTWDEAVWRDRQHRRSSLVQFGCADVEERHLISIRPTGGVVADEERKRVKMLNHRST